MNRHAKIEFCPFSSRVKKRYEKAFYANNEYSALKMLSEFKIMDLRPQKESETEISMDYIKNTRSPEIENEKFIYNLAMFLKKLHYQSKCANGCYLTHGDIFEDNILLSRDTDKIYVIDWGLAKNEDNIYRDIASCLLGVFNKSSKSFRLFLNQYFEDTSKIDFSLINNYLEIIYNEFKLIRLENNFEIQSLETRFEKARGIIQTWRGI